MKMSAGEAEEMETPPESTSRKFTSRTDELAFTQHPSKFHTTRVYIIRPPKSLSSTDRLWITAQETTADYTLFFRHPLTSKPHSFNLPSYFYISKLNPITLSVFYAFRQPYSVDKLLILQPSQYSVDKHKLRVLKPSKDRYMLVGRCTVFALYGGGLLQGCPHEIQHRRYQQWRSTPVNIYRSTNLPWVNLTPRPRCVVKFDDIIDFQDKLYAIDRQGITYLVNYTVATISMGKTLIFEPLTPGSGQFGWRKRFAIDGETLYVLVRTEEKLFNVFRLKSRVKTTGAICYYWDRVKRFKGNKVLFMAREHYFFRRATRKFPGREYKNCIVFSEAAFPQYGNGCWEFTETDNVRRCEDDIAVFRLDDQRFAREEEWENSGFPKIDWSPPEWILNFSYFPANEFQKHSVSEASSQSERASDEDEGLDSDSGEKNDGEVQSGLNDSKASGNGAMEEGTSGKSMTQVVTKASTSSRTECHKSDSATTKFEGFDVRLDSVLTLEKIWQKHGNIVENSAVRNGEIIARALDSLATIVRILDDNTALSLNDIQADYIVSTLSDLRYIHFKVDWLIPFVEKAKKIHQSKPSLESLNTLSQYSSQAQERRAILLDELTKLDVEEKKRNEEMAKISKTIPFWRQVKIDEPLGSGLT